jgi:hypothetical protein
MSDIQDRKTIRPDLRKPNGGLKFAVRQRASTLVKNARGRCNGYLADSDEAYGGAEQECRNGCSASGLLLHHDDFISTL